MGITAASATAASSGLAGGFIILVAVMVIAAWCVPLIIAALFGLPRKGAVAVLTLALGWTGIAWLAALVIVTVGAILASRDGVRPAPTGPQYREATGPPWTPPPPAGRYPTYPSPVPGGEPGRSRASHRAP